MLTKQWDKAEAEGRELMKPEYGFELVPEYKDIFTLANEKNPEIIWACQCAKGYQEHKWQPHVLPNDYNFTSYLDKMTKWNGYKISWDFMQTFDPADRRLLTIAYEYTSKDGVVHNEKNDRPDPSAQLYLGAVPLKYEFVRLYGRRFTNRLDYLPVCRCAHFDSRGILYATRMP